MIKKTIILAITITTLLSCNSARHTVAGQNDVYKGTWHYQSGNQLFIVSLWNEQSALKGHYKMVTVDDNGMQTGIVYNSNKLWGNTGQNWPFSVYCGFNATTALGTINDNTVTGVPKGFIEGNIELTLQIGTPITMHWKVNRSEGIRFSEEPDFNIPTDIVLTKISSDVDLD